MPNRVAETFALCTCYPPRFSRVIVLFSLFMEKEDAKIETTADENDDKKVAGTACV